MPAVPFILLTIFHFFEMSFAYHSFMILRNGVNSLSPSSLSTPSDNARRSAFHCADRRSFSPVFCSYLFSILAEPDISCRFFLAHPGEKLLDAEWNVIFRRVMYYCICADLQSVRKERDSVQLGSCLSVFHIEIRLHVQQQTGPGHEIHLQNVVRQRRDGGKIPSVQRCTLFHNLFYR